MKNNVKTASKELSYKLREMSSNRRAFEWCKKRSILYGAVSVMSQLTSAIQYFTVLKQEIRFTRGLNTAKIHLVSRNASNKNS